MNYKLVISHDDWLEKMQSKGYDFNDTSILDGHHFSSQEEAIDDYFQDIFDTIHALIRENRGERWAKLFFEDMTKDLTSDVEAQEYKQHLIDALIQQAVYIYDNGDSDASGEINPDRNPYAPKAVKALWGNILRG